MQKKTEEQKDPYQSITVKLRRDAAFTASLDKRYCLYQELFEA